MDILRHFQLFSGFHLSSVLWENRVKMFDIKYATCVGSFVSYTSTCQIDYWYLICLYLLFYVSCMYPYILYVCCISIRISGEQ